MIGSLQERVLELIRKEMVKRPNTKGFLIDGFPRELEQGQEFEKEVRVFAKSFYSAEMEKSVVED